MNNPKVVRMVQESRREEDVRIVDVEETVRCAICLSSKHTTENCPRKKDKQP